VSQEPSEQDLIEAYRRTVKPLYAYVSRRVGGDVSLAEDLVQDTWMRAIGSWPAKRIPDDPLAWLVRVARNTLVSHCRHRRPQLLDPALLDLIESQPSTASEDPGAASVVNWGLAGFAARMRSCSRISTSPARACATWPANARCRNAPSKGDCGAPVKK
jgi:DNA-directed RNA polymerase specialized sigma24 family protein